MATYNGNSLTGKEEFLKGDIINFSYSGLKDNRLDSKPNSNIYDNSYSIQTFDYESFSSVLGE